MRCKKCGFPNRPGAVECANCHAPLEEETSSRPMNATVSEQEVFGLNQDDERVCPKCGYPIRNNAQTCPNCNYHIGELYNNRFNDDIHRPTRMENPMRDNKVTGTINPYMESASPEPGFVLSPVKRINEKKELVDLEYVGKDVVLNRENTEPDNGSITSHEQALLSYNNGHWTIEDKSEQGTTFVRASKAVELHDGDVILLGNRLFKFCNTENR